MAGGDYRNDTLYWWENPYPHYAPDQPWKRHVVKTGYGNQHHDQIVGDFDGDGKPDLVCKPYNWQTPRLDIWLMQNAGDETV